MLSILKKGESYGYEIIQQVKKLSEEELNWTDGMLYPVLHRLEKEKLIESNWRTSEAGRKRKYYSITQSGLKELGEEQRQWNAVNKTVQKLWRPSYV